MKTKTIYVFDMEQNTIVKISKKARKRAKKIIKKRELEARIVANVEKAEAFDAYMANKIMSDKMEEKRPVVVNLERLVGNLNVVIDSKPSLDNPYEPVVAPLNHQFEKLHDLIRETLLKAVHQAKPE